MKLRSILTRTLLAGAMLTLASTTSHAALVTFEGFGANTIFGDENVGNGLQVATTGGFNFTSSGDHFHIGNGLATPVSNGTSILSSDRSYVMTMQPTNALPFDFLSGDFGETVDSNSATAITVTGFINGGGTISTSVVLDGNLAGFQSANFANFTNLTSLTFQGTGGDGWFALDNLSTQPSAVPEPTTALFGLALVGFCTTARRRRAQAQA